MLSARRARAHSRRASYLPGLHRSRLLPKLALGAAAAALLACETGGGRSRATLGSAIRGPAASDAREPPSLATAPVVPVSRDADAAAAADAEPAPEPASAPSPRALPPLASRPASIALPVPGFGDAVAVLPVGATRARPIVVALHGLGDRPEWQCAAWSAVLAGRAFVVCPRGIPGAQATTGDPRLTYAGAEALRFETAAAVEALRAAYPAYADAGPVVYTGFSLGAVHGVPCMVHDPGTYPLAILTEGGHDGWTSDAASAFAARGGKRVLFLCGTESCAVAASQAQARLVAAGVEARLRHLRWLGHVYGASIFDPSAADIAWVLASDPRFDD
jgi:predicted esterase